MTTQKDLILSHLRDKGTITSMEAIREYGITRLGAVIFFLREDGYNIDTDMVSTKNRYGHPVRFAKYSLEE